MIKAAEELIAYCRDNHRVCPQPDLWLKLWEILPREEHDGVNRNPSLPLILAAWHDTPAMMKMLRLADHIEWAERHGCLEQVAQFLYSLKEEDWHHIQG